MALKEFWGFDGLPAYTGNVNISVLSFMRSDIISSIPNPNASYGTCYIQKNAAGWILGNGFTVPYPQTNYGNVQSQFSIPYQNISDFTTRRSFFGFRWQMNNVTAAYFPWIVQIKNTAGTTQVLVPVTASIIANQSQYIEVMIDRLNTQIVVWIDGTQVSTTFFDFNSFVSADGNCVLTFAPPANSNAVMNWQMRDPYFLDDTQDSTQCNRLGPIDIRPAPLASAAAPNWTSSDSGTPLSDLSTVLGITGPTQTAPTQTESPTMDPVTLAFGAGNLVASEPIIGYRMDITAQRTPGYVFAPTTKVVYNSQTATGKQLTYPNGAQMYYNQNVYLAEKAPDGTAWTAASLAAAQLTLTP